MGTGTDLEYELSQHLPLPRVRSERSGRVANETRVPVGRRPPGSTRYRQGESLPRGGSERSWNGEDSH